MHRGLNPCHVYIASVSHPCCIRVVRIKSVSHSHHIRVESTTMIICPSWSTFVRITAVRRPCRVRVISLQYPSVNLHKDMPRMSHEYDKDNTDAGQTWHGGDTDICLCQLFWLCQNNRHGQIWPWRPLRTWPGCDTNMNRGRQGHDTDTCPCHVRVPIRVCVNVA